jgi:hypothetical protein
MPLACDVLAGASVRLSSALGHTGWDPGMGPERPREPPSHRAAARSRPLNRSHSRLTRHERLKVGVGRKAEDARQTSADVGAIKPKWASGWPSGRRVPPPRRGYGTDPRRSEHDVAAEQADSALWAWRRRSPVDIERMMAAQRDDRAYHRHETELLGADWPQPSSTDLYSPRSGPAAAVVPPGNRATSWELEYEFHTAAARTAGLRQQIAEREAQWDGFVGPGAMEPRQALQTYEQQQVLLQALRKEAEWLRQAAGNEATSAYDRLNQPGAAGAVPVDFPGGMAGDVGIAWSPGYSQAWAGAAQNYDMMMMQQYGSAGPAVGAPAGAPVGGMGMGMAELEAAAFDQRVWQRQQAQPQAQAQPQPVTLGLDSYCHSSHGYGYGYGVGGGGGGGPPPPPQLSSGAYFDDTYAHR